MRKIKPRHAPVPTPADKAAQGPDTRADLAARAWLLIELLAGAGDDSQLIGDCIAVAEELVAERDKGRE